MSRSDQLLDDFEKFHREHPEVWRMFVRFACEMMDRGFKHYSADAICHRIRWEIDITSHERFKINDHHTVFFARAWALEFPHRKHFFRFRHRPSEKQGERIGFDSPNSEAEIDSEVEKRLRNLLQ